MTANTLVRPLPESAGPDHNTTEPRHAHTPAPNPDRPHRRNRNDRGFSMLELLVGMVILGILGAIGYGIYTNFIGDARDTALDQNIQTAAAELQSVLALEPTLATNTATGAVVGVPSDDLITAMTNRTNFVWDTTWAFDAAGNEPDIIRMQFIEDAAADIADGVTPPKVSWLVDNQSAVRIHLSNPEGEWRCAVLILKPSTTGIDGLGAAATDVDAELATQKSAELRGVWYDGGSTLTAAGLHDCSPAAGNSTGAWNVADELTCTAGPPNAVAASDECLPADAQTWHIPGLITQIDASSTAEPLTTTVGVRTLHRSASSIDSNA